MGGAAPVIRVRRAVNSIDLLRQARNPSPGTPGNSSWKMRLLTQQVTPSVLRSALLAVLIGTAKWGRNSTTPSLGMGHALHQQLEGRVVGDVLARHQLVTPWIISRKVANVRCT